ncbi:hypothetical protein B0H14DRAFT_2592370 [Mycena olivaceomarginata]|nr:hypothetical protein B0H14DRAFT_2592370 [Mycena olivaceomarginata]
MSPTSRGWKPTGRISRLWKRLMRFNCRLLQAEAILNAPNIIGAPTDGKHLPACNPCSAFRVIRAYINTCQYVGRADVKVQITGDRQPDIVSWMAHSSEVSVEYQDFNGTPSVDFSSCDNLRCGKKEAGFVNIAKTEDWKAAQSLIRRKLSAKTGNMHTRSYLEGIAERHKKEEEAEFILWCSEEAEGSGSRSKTEMNRGLKSVLFLKFFHTLDNNFGFSSVELAIDPNKF